jgi:hypothetical protein
MGADAAKRRVFRRYAERTRDRGGFGGGEYPTLSTSGSLPGSSIRSVTDWISATSAGSGACNVVAAQSAINGHWSQSTGADLSGQHGMSSDMAAVSSDIDVIAIDAIAPVFARAVSGAMTRPTITRTASSRQRWIERFTGSVSHNPTGDGKPGSNTKSRVSLTYASNPSEPAGSGSYRRIARTFFRVAT